MSFVTKVWRGKFSLGFTFWVMGCLVPTPIFVAKYYLQEAGILGHPDLAVHLAAQAFLWLEWSYFAFITVALWNAASSHLERARLGGNEKALWGHAGRLLAFASGMLAAGSFANLTGITEKIVGRTLFIGIGAG